VGAAIGLYLRKSRPPLPVPEVFTTVLAPCRPLTRASVTHIVRSALRRTGIQAPINGAHVLRPFADGLGLRAVVDHQTQRANPIPAAGTPLQESRDALS